MQQHQSETLTSIIDKHRTWSISSIRFCQQRRRFSEDRQIAGQFEAVDPVGVFHALPFVPVVPVAEMEMPVKINAAPTR